MTSSDSLRVMRSTKGRRAPDDKPELLVWKILETLEATMLEAA